MNTVSDLIYNNYFKSIFNPKQSLKESCWPTALKIASCFLVFPPILMGIAWGSTFLIGRVTSSFFGKTVEKIDKIANSSIKAIFSPKSNGVRESFKAFITELENEIFPFYEKHENGFDQDRIHGRMHIARAVIFAELMARYFDRKDIEVDFSYVRRATGMHDAGRKANGEDRWEKESSELFYQHLISKGVPTDEALKKSKIINKSEADQTSKEYIIFQSADCLDIMRPCTGRQGLDGFNREFLQFLKEAPSEEAKFRERLIQEAWIFIKITECQKMTTFNESEGFMDKLFYMIRINSDMLPILSSICPSS